MAPRKLDIWHIATYSWYMLNEGGSQWSDRPTPPGLDDNDS